MINEFAEAISYRDIGEFKKEITDTVNINPSGRIHYDCLKNMRGFIRPMTILARYYLYHDKDIKNLNVEEQMIEVIKKLKNWTENKVIKYAQNLVECGKTKESLSHFYGEKPSWKEKCKCWAENNWAIYDRAVTYKSIIADALNEGELMKYNYVVIPKSVMDIIRDATQKAIDSSNKKPKTTNIAQAFESVLIMMIVYYNLMLNRYDKNKYVLYNQTDFNNWINNQKFDESYKKKIVATGLIEFKKIDEETKIFIKDCHIPAENFFKELSGEEIYIKNEDFIFQDCGIDTKDIVQADYTKYINRVTLKEKSEPKTHLQQEFVFNS